MLKGSCQPDSALTPPARLAAVGRRLDTMLQAVKLVQTALNDFYGILTDEPGWTSTVLPILLH